MNQIYNQVLNPIVSSATDLIFNYEDCKQLFLSLFKGKADTISTLICQSGKRFIQGSLIAIIWGVIYFNNLYKGTAIDITPILKRYINKNLDINDKFLEQIELNIKLLDFSESESEEPKIYTKFVKSFSSVLDQVRSFSNVMLDFNDKFEHSHKTVPGFNEEGSKFLYASKKIIGKIQVSDLDTFSKYIQQINSYNFTKTPTGATPFFASMKSYRNFIDTVKFKNPAIITKAIDIDADMQNVLQDMKIILDKRDMELLPISYLLNVSAEYTTNKMEFLHSVDTAQKKIESKVISKIKAFSGSPLMNTSMLDFHVTLLPDTYSGSTETILNESSTLFVILLLIFIFSQITKCWRPARIKRQKEARKNAIRNARIKKRSDIEKRNYSKLIKDTDDLLNESKIMLSDTSLF